MGPIAEDVTGYTSQRRQARTRSPRRWPSRSAGGSDDRWCLADQRRPERLGAYRGYIPDRRIRAVTIRHQAQDTVVKATGGKLWKCPSDNTCGRCLDVCSQELFGNPVRFSARRIDFKWKCAFSRIAHVPIVTLRWSEAIHSVGSVDGRSPGPRVRPRPYTALENARRHLAGGLGSPWPHPRCTPCPRRPIREESLTPTCLVTGEGSGNMAGRSPTRKLHNRTASVPLIGGVYSPPPLTGAGVGGPADVCAGIP